MKRLKNLVNAILNLFGYKIQKEIPDFLKQVVNVCDLTDCPLLVDVGANTGQYGRMILKSGFKGKLVSFEPQAAAHAKLLLSSKNWLNWEVASPCVLGEKDVKEVDLFLSDNSVSSSLLKKSNENSDLFNQVGIERVRMLRFENFYKEHFSSEKFFLKIDTQGYELGVLKGCESILDNCIGIQLEVSIFETYIGSPGYFEILSWLQDRGFAIYDCLPESRNRHGRLLEMDLLMINKDYV